MELTLLKLMVFSQLNRTLAAEVTHEELHAETSARVREYKAQKGMDG